MDFLESQVLGSRKDGFAKTQSFHKERKKLNEHPTLNYLHNADLHNAGRTRLSATIKPHIVVRLSYTSWTDRTSDTLHQSQSPADKRKTLSAREKTTYSDN